MNLIQKRNISWEQKNKVRMSKAEEELPKLEEKLRTEIEKEKNTKREREAKRKR